MEPKETAKPAPSVAETTVGQRAQAGQSYAGILVHHGAAPLELDDTDQGNYYVTLQTPDGEQVLWGPELAHAMMDTRVASGDPVLLTSKTEGGKVAWHASAIDTATLDVLNQRSNYQPAPVASQPNGAPAPAEPASDSLDPDTLQAIMNVVSHQKTEEPKLNPEDVQRVNESLRDTEDTKAPQPERPLNAAENLIKGTAQLASGVASLTGAAMQGLGKGASALASAMGGSGTAVEARAPASDLAATEELPGRVPVLPRLSEYRVDQVEKAANNYHKAHEAFWSADKMPEVREQIETRAAQDGLSPAQVIEKMKPDGEYSELHQVFVNAVGQSPEAQDSKKAMDKALTGWARQYGRAQEELLNPETEGNPHYEKLKDRLNTSSTDMHRDAANTPTFSGETQSHLERLQDVMERIAERLKEMVKGVVDLVRNSLPGASRDNDFVP